MTMERFGVVLRDLVIERGFTTRTGNANWASFAKTLGGVHYETLRKAAAGERPPTLAVMELVADKLGVDPAETFAEYRLWAVRREFDPQHVGIDRALRTLDAWDRFLLGGLGAGTAGRSCYEDSAK